MAALAALEMLANSPDVSVLLHLGLEARRVELQTPRVLLQVLRIEMLLIVEKQVMHFPEPALTGRAFRCLGRGEGVRVDTLEWKMTVRKPNPADVTFQEHLYGRRSLLADGAFEVAIFDDGNGGIVRTQDVICGSDCYGQVDGSGHGVPPVGSFAWVGKRLYSISWRVDSY